MSETTAAVPPIGVMPEWVWREKRIRDLLEAILRYVDVPPTPRGRECLVAWTEETLAHLKWLREREALRSRETGN